MADGRMHEHGNQAKISPRALKHGPMVCDRAGETAPIDAIAPSSSIRSSTPPAKTSPSRPSKARPWLAAGFSAVGRDLRFHRAIVTIAVWQSILGCQARASNTATGRVHRLWAAPTRHAAIAPAWRPVGCPRPSPAARQPRVVAANSSIVLAVPAVTVRGWVASGLMDHG